MKYRIDEIEDALLATLQGSAELAAASKTIASYHGELDALVAEVPQLTIALPAVFVLYSGSKFDEIANCSFDDAMSFTVVTIAQSLRSSGTDRSALRDGVYDLLELEKAALLPNVTLGLDVQPVKPVQIDQVRVTEEFSIYAFTIRINDCME